MPSMKRRIQSAFTTDSGVYLVTIGHNDSVTIYPGTLVRIEETKYPDGNKRTIYTIKHIRLKLLKSDSFIASVLCLTQAAAAKAAKMLLKQISGELNQGGDIMKKQFGDMWKLREVWRKKFESGSSDYVRRINTEGEGCWRFAFNDGDEEPIEDEHALELEGQFTAMLDAAFLKPEVVVQDGIIRIKCRTKDVLHYDVEIRLNTDDALDLANRLKMAMQNLKTLEVEGQ